MHQLFLVKTGTLSRADIKRAERLCGICIVECSEPEAARYSEPPIGADIEHQAKTALDLLNWIIAQPNDTAMYRNGLSRIFVDLLLNGKNPVSIPVVAKTPKQ